MSRAPRWHRRSRAERLRDRGDVRRLARDLDLHEWLVDRDDRVFDLAVGRRIAAVTALGQIDNQEAEDTVVRALGDGDVRVRRAAVDALRPAPSARALTQLARAAATWSDPVLADAREAAIALLVDVGDELVAVEYTQTLIDEPGRSSLGPGAASVVGRLFAADSGTVAGTFVAQLVQRLRAEGDPGDNLVVAETLAAMGDIAVVPLIAALHDPAVRQSAAAVLGDLRDARAVPALTDVLAAGDPGDRAAAARALGDIRDPRALDPLLRASGDPRVEVRDAALEALDRMRGAVIAMLGTAANGDQARDGPGPQDGEPSMAGPRFPGHRPEQRSVMRWLLGRDEP